MLHLTNGDSAIPALRAAGAEGEVMPWREVLHDGPVPALPADELRAVRGRFLGDEARLRDRDERLSAGAPLVTEGQRELARHTWAAFTADDPLAMERIAAGTPALPAVGQRGRHSTGWRRC